MSKSWSAERRLGCGKDGFRTIQNSNSGDVEQLPLLLLLPLLLGERIWAAAGLSVGLSIEREREREIEVGVGVDVERTFLFLSKGALSSEFQCK